MPIPPALFIRQNTLTGDGLIQSGTIRVLSCVSAEKAHHPHLFMAGSTTEHNTDLKGGPQSPRLIKKLEEECKEIGVSRERLLRWLCVALGAAALIFFIVGLWLCWTETFARFSVAIGFAIVILAIAQGLYSSMRHNEQRHQELDFQIDLLQSAVCEREARAEKVLRLHTALLHRYYDVNLRQNVWVFALGVFCILLGVSTIGVTLYLISQPGISSQIRNITAILGAVGAVLTNFIAAIYLKMHAAAAINLGRFHARLCQTNQTLFGNLVASRISDDQTRWKTLSDIAVNVSKFPMEEWHHDGAKSSRHTGFGDSKHSRDNKKKEDEA